MAQPEGERGRGKRERKRKRERGREGEGRGTESKKYDPFKAFRSFHNPVQTKSIVIISYLCGYLFRVSSQYLRAP